MKAKRERWHKRNERSQVTCAFASLLDPALAAVEGGPQLAAAGRKNNFRRRTRVDACYIGAERAAIGERINLSPVRAPVGGMEERARLASGPDSVIASGETKQGMVRAQTGLPGGAVIQ